MEATDRIGPVGLSFSRRGQYSRSGCPAPPGRLRSSPGCPRQDLDLRRLPPRSRTGCTQLDLRSFGRLLAVPLGSGAEAAGVQILGRGGIREPLGIEMGEVATGQDAFAGL